MASKPIIIHWIHGLQGGAGIMAINICIQLNKLGYDNIIVFQDSHGPEKWGTSKRSNEEKFRFSKIVHIQNKKLFKTFVNQINPTIIVYHIWRMSENRPILTGFKQVAYIHTSRLPNISGYDYYILVSHSQFRTLPLPKKLVREKVSVIRNGVDMNRFPDFRKKRINNNQSLTIIRSSGLNKEKYSPVNFKIYDYFKSETVKFILLGTGNYIDTIKQYLIENSINNVEIVGDVDLATQLKYFRKSDLVLYLTGSHLENHSLSILESMMMGLPVIAEDKGGLVEQIDNWRTGVICYSLKDVIEAIERIKNDRNLLNTLSNNAMSYAKHFSINSTVKDLKYILEKILNSN